jgi:hypothetical protein
MSFINFPTSSWPSQLWVLYLDPDAHMPLESDPQHYFFKADFNDSHLFYGGWNKDVAGLEQDVLPRIFLKSIRRNSGCQKIKNRYRYVL